MRLLDQGTSLVTNFGSVRQLYEVVNIPNQVSDGPTPFPENQKEVLSGVLIEFRLVPSAKTSGSD